MRRARSAARAISVLREARHRCRQTAEPALLDVIVASTITAMDRITIAAASFLALLRLAASAQTSTPAAATGNAVRGKTFTLRSAAINAMVVKPRARR